MTETTQDYSFKGTYWRVTVLDRQGGPIEKKWFIYEGEAKEGARYFSGKYPHMKVTLTKIEGD